MFKFDVAPLDLPVADRFALIVRELVRSVVGREMWLGHAVVALICGRLGRWAVRFQSLAAQAGVAASTGGGAARVAGPRGVRPPVLGISRVVTSLPRGFAWLVRLVPEAPNFGGKLAHLLEDPEMAALVLASPGLGRVLRPLCRMLGVSPLPASIRPEPRPAAGRSEPATRSGRAERSQALPTRAERTRGELRPADGRDAREAPSRVRAGSADAVRVAREGRLARRPRSRREPVGALRNGLDWSAAYPPPPGFSEA